MLPVIDTPVAAEQLHRRKVLLLLLKDVAPCVYPFHPCARESPCLRRYAVSRRVLVVTYLHVVEVRLHADIELVCLYVRRAVSLLAEHAALTKQPRGETLAYLQALNETDETKSRIIINP